MLSATAWTAHSFNRQQAIKTFRWEIISINFILIFSLFQRVLQRQASLGKRSSLISQTAAPTVTSVQ